jgi:hypothetical protein
MCLLKYVLNCEQPFTVFIFQTGLTVSRSARVYCVMLRIGTGSVLIPDTLRNCIFMDISMLRTTGIRAVSSRLLKYPFMIRRMVCAVPLQIHE